MSPASKNRVVLAALAVAMMSTLCGPASRIAKADSAVTLSWFSDVPFWSIPQPWSTNPNSVEGVFTANTGLQFTTNIPAQDGDTKLNLMMATGKLPDVITITDGPTQQKLIASGKVWKLDDFFNQYDPHSSLVQQFPKDVKQALINTYGGWYSYPSHQDSPDGFKEWKPASQLMYEWNTMGDNNELMINSYLLKQAGLSLAQLGTESGLLNAFKKIESMHLKYQGAPVIPLQIDGKVYQTSTLPVLAQMFGAMPVDKAGNYRDPLLAPETKHALDFLVAAQQAGAFDQGQATEDDTATLTAVKSGRVFAFLGNVANTGFSDNDNPVTWVSPGAILADQGLKPAYGIHEQATTGWMQTFISKSASDPAGLAKWLDYMTSDQALRVNVYGFKGVHYSLNPQGLIVTTKQWLVDSANPSKTGVYAFWPFMNIPWVDHVTATPKNVKGNGGLEAMEIQTAFGRTPNIYKYDNSAFSMPVNFIAAGSAMGNAQTQMQSYELTQISAIVFAGSSADENKLYGDLIARLHQMGIDKIDAQMNGQFHKQEQQLGEHITGLHS